MGKLSKTRKNPKPTEKTILMILLPVFVTHLNSIFQKEFVFDDRNRDPLTKLIHIRTSGIHDPEGVCPGQKIPA